MFDQKGNKSLAALIALGGLDAGLESRLRAGCGIAMDNVPGSRSVQFLGGTAEKLFSLFDLAGLKGFHNALNAVTDGPLDSTVPLTTDDILTQTLFGTSQIRHNLSR